VPNWCNNSITITGPIAVIRTLYEGAVAGNFCNTVYPIPQMLVDTVSGSVGKPGSVEQIEHEEQEQRNIELFGYKNWYDFCVAQWGVKWDFGSDDAASFSDNGNGTATLILGDDTAWSPPCGIFEKLHAQGLDVLAYYYEPGMAFCGQWHNGADEYYKILGNSDWVDANIPADINEAFAIAETMSEWEQIE
jgi:hypothetical protein